MIDRSTEREREREREREHITEEVDRTEEQFLQSWQWVYSIYSRRCLEQNIISKTEEGVLELQCIDEWCSSCDQRQ